MGDGAAGFEEPLAARRRPPAGPHAVAVRPPAGPRAVAARPPAGPRATATACDVDTVRNYARANSVRMT